MRAARVGENQLIRHGEKLASCRACRLRAGDEAEWPVRPSVTGSEVVLMNMLMYGRRHQSYRRMRSALMLKRKQRWQPPGAEVATLLTERGLPVASPCNHLCDLTRRLNRTACSARASSGCSILKKRKQRHSVYRIPLRVQFCIRILPQFPYPNLSGAGTEEAEAKPSGGCAPVPPPSTESDSCAAAGPIPGRARAHPCSSAARPAPYNRASTWTSATTWRGCRATSATAWTSCRATSATPGRHVLVNSSPLQIRPAARSSSASVDLDEASRGRGSQASRLNLAQTHKAARRNSSFASSRVQAPGRCSLKFCKKFQI